MASEIEIRFEEKLKKLSADFEFFAHITSHDLRDPLRQARIYSDELLQTIPAGDKPKLESINFLIDEVLKKIAILRDFSYVSNDTETRTSVDLNKIVGEVILELDGKIKSANAKIEITNLPTIPGNEKHLKRLFAYLIDNAIKFRYGERGLQISIRTFEEDGFHHFIIKDNGIGLEKVYRELVFVLFQRLDNTITDGSYGEGLAFARKIVENHGGKIWYESDGESGTDFNFTLKK